MQSFFEPRFGVDLSQVRVHTDSQASQSAKSLSALAYTVGRNIVFAEGNYRPETNEGKKLLGHELVHVVHQNRASADDHRPAEVLRRKLDTDSPRHDVDPRARVDQLQLAIKLVPFDWRFHIDRTAAALALAGLTDADGRAIKAEYKRRTSWDLGWLISGQLEFDNSLGTADRKRLLNLLSGTVALASTDPTHGQAAGELVGALAGGVATLLGRGEEADRISEAVAAGLIGNVVGQEKKAEAAASTRRYAAEAAALKAALDEGDAETALTLIRRPMAENQALADQYYRHFDQYVYFALVASLRGRDLQRAAALWRGDLITADRLALEGNVERLEKAEDLVGRGIWLPDLADKMRRRQEARAAVESRLETIGRSGDKGPAENPAQGREHLAAVLAQGDDHGTLAAKLGVGKDSVVSALVQRQEPEELAARLARADLEGSLNSADLEAALRRLRTLAREAALREIEHQPAALGPLAENVLAAVTLGYYLRFRERFEHDDTKRSLDKVMASVGGDVEGERNRALLARQGALPAWQELDFALRRQPKDMDRVRRVLGNKTKRQVDELAVTYWIETKIKRGLNGSLEADLMGSEDQQLFEQFRDKDAAKEAQAEKRMLLQGGVFSSTATDETTRLAEEGSWTFGRIVALERRVMENRGLFAEAHDWVGNLEYELVERARDDATNAKTALSLALANSPPGLATARAQLEELRHIAARLERNVGIYKEATAEAFNEFVDFAVLAVTTFVTLGEGTAIMLAVRATMATIGTKLVLKGDDYGPDEFLKDVRNGLGTAVGGKLAEGIFKPLASRLASYAENGGLSRTLASKVGSALIWEGQNVVQTVTTSAFTNQDLTTGLGAAGHVQNLAMLGVATVGKAALGHGRGRAVERIAAEGKAGTSTHLGEEPSRAVTEPETPARRAVEGPAADLGDEPTTEFKIPMALEEPTVVTHRDETRAPGDAHYEHPASKSPGSGAELDASVARSSHLDKITDQQAANEVAYVDKHPELPVEGTPPHVKLGEHEIVEVAGGGCERHSGGGKILGTCPVRFVRERVNEHLEQMIEDHIDPQSLGYRGREWEEFGHNLENDPKRALADLEGRLSRYRVWTQKTSGLTQIDVGSGPNPLELSVSSETSLARAEEAGIPSELTGDATVMTQVDFPEVVPNAPPATGRPAPAQLQPVTQMDPSGSGFAIEGRPISRSEMQNVDMLHDYDLLLRAGADPALIRVNQRQVIGERAVGTNRPDLYAVLPNGQRIHIEYDRAPGTRAMDHARRILTNDPHAIVILKIIDFD
jgi:hypothetical protein